MSIRLRFDKLWMPEPFSGCWLWTGNLHRQGYGRMTTGSRSGTRKTGVKAHRVSWELYRGVIPPSTCVLHKCDTPSCVNPDHLFLGSNADNKADCVKKQRHTWPEYHGQEHPEAKLTESKVLSIRKDNRTQQRIADDYKVSRQLISLIKRNKIWRHL